MNNSELNSQVEDSVVMELKNPQELNYRVASMAHEGLLINFGSQSLEVKHWRHPKNRLPGTIPESNHP
jgi:hypothetical protein